MKKHLFLKSLLIAIGLLMTCINTAWGQVFGAAEQQQTAIQSQQIMSGGTYNGTVYEPFSNSTPSEQSAVGASYSPAKAPSGPRKSRTPGEATSGTDLSPIGEPWVMVILALGFIGIIFIRKRKQINQTTDMKNSTKYIAILALFLTFGIGNTWADDYGIYKADITIEKDGGAATTYTVNNNTDPNYPYNPNNVGVISGLNITAASVFIYRNWDYSKCWDGTGGAFNYRLWHGSDNITHENQGSGSSKWKEIVFDDYGGDGDAKNQKISKDDGIVNVFSEYDLTPGESYTLEFWYKTWVSCSSLGDKEWNNNDNLYKITFTVEKFYPVYFRTTNDKPWLTPYIKQWNGSGNSGFQLLTSYNDWGTGKWWTTNLSNRWTNFLVSANSSPSNNACNAGDQTVNLTISSSMANHGYQIHCKNDKTDIDEVFDNVANLTAPTVVVDYAEAGKTILALTGHITNFGYDINYVNNGYECGFTLTDSESNSVNYNADCVIDDASGYFYKTITGLKEGETYTVKAWAKNGYARGESSGRSVSMKKAGSVRVWVYNQQNYGTVWLHCWYTNNCSGTTHTDANVSELAFPGKQMHRLGTSNWWYFDVSNDYPRFMVSDGGNSNKTGDKGASDYAYFTNSGNTLAEYTGALRPTAYYNKTTLSTDTIYYSNVVATTEDTMSFFAANNNRCVVKLVKTDGTETTIDMSSYFSVGDKGAVFTARTNGGGLTDVKKFDGDYHIHMKVTSENYLEDGESKPGTSGTKFIHFETSSVFDDLYNYYWVDWISGSHNLVATVGNQYNDNLAGILAADAFAPKGATSASGGNVRFGYNPETNFFERAIVSGSGSDIKLKGSAASTVMTGASYDNDTYSNPASFGDATNWVYNISAQVKGQSRATVTSRYNDGTQTLALNNKLIGGNSLTSYVVEIDYDFKTNRLIAAWKPTGEITGFDLESNLMAVRTENGAPTVLNIQQADLDNDKITLTKITKIYTVLELLQASWRNSAQYTSRRIDADSWCDEYYWIALPYDCYIGDIFGITKYGSGDNDKWVLQRYRGDLRAQQGWWAETETWWEDMARTDTLKAGQGYVLRVTNLDGDHSSTRVFAEDSGDNKLYLYFPSMGTDLSLGLIKNAAGDGLATSMTSTVPAHTCDKWRGKDDKPQTNEGNPRYDRRAIDSNWNIIGSPSFNSTKITSPTWGDTYPTSPDVKGTLKFFYTWAANTNPKYTVKTNSSFSSFEYKATHAYLVQYAGDITWAPYDASNPLVELKAPKRTNDETGDQTLKLTLMRGTVQADVTYISRIAEGATEGYDLNMDLSKLTSSTGDNLYTIAGYYKMAGNCLPDTTSIVPVGVMIAQTGEYTFAMPEGTYGTGITLVDNVANTRTNLALTDYTVNLEPGTYDDRFLLEISPIANIPTGIEQSQMTNDQLQIKKIMVDGVLYIVRDGNVFDAIGNKVN